MIVTCLGYRIKWSHDVPQNRRYFGGESDQASPEYFVEYYRYTTWFELCIWLCYYYYYYPSPSSSSSLCRVIHTYIPETNYVPREYSVAAILLLLFMVLISLLSVLNLLCFYINTFRSMRAMPNMAVFCSSMTSWIPGMLLTYFLNDFEIVPVAPIITGIIFFFLDSTCAVFIL